MTDVLGPGDAVAVRRVLNAVGADLPADRHADFWEALAEADRMADLRKVMSVETSAPLAALTAVSNRTQDLLVALQDSALGDRLSDVEATETLRKLRTLADLHIGQLGTHEPLRGLSPQDTYYVALADAARKFLAIGRTTVLASGEPGPLSLFVQAVCREFGRTEPTAAAIKAGLARQIRLHRSQTS